MNRKENFESSPEILLETERQVVSKNVDKYLGKISYFDGGWMVQGRNETNLKKMIDNNGAQGQCYILSYFYCLVDNSYQLVQGICSIDDKESAVPKRIEHSWCEKGDFVYDLAWGNKLTTKEKFYKENNVDEESINVYSAKEATNNYPKYLSFRGWDGGEESKKQEEIVKKNDYYKYVRKCFQKLYENRDKIQYFYWEKEYLMSPKFVLQIEGEEKEKFDVHLWC